MLSSIQILRAFAAWSVVFHHYMQIFHNFNSSNPVSKFFSEYGLLGVDLFFIISGFVIYNSISAKKITPVNFGIQRIARIVPAYWLFTGLTALLAYSFEGLMPKTEFETTHFIKSLLFIPGYSPTGIGLLPTLSVGWTLNYEMLFYGIFFVSLFLPRSLLIPSIILAIAAVQITATGSDGVFSFYGRPLIYDFIIGIALSIVYRAGLISKISTVSALVITSIAIFCMFVAGDLGHSPIKAGIPLALIFACFASQEKELKRISFFKHLGDWSYSTYLAHVIAICLMLKAYSLYPDHEIVMLAGTIAITLITSWLSFKYVEKPISSIFKQKPEENIKVDAVDSSSGGV